MGTLELIILIVVLLALFGGGGGYYWRHGRRKDSLPCHRFSCDGQAAAVPGFCCQRPAGSPRPHLSVSALLKPQPRAKYAGRIS